MHSSKTQTSVPAVFVVYKSGVSCTDHSIYAVCLLFSLVASLLFRSTDHSMYAATCVKIQICDAVSPFEVQAPEDEGNPQEYGATGKTGVQIVLLSTT